MSAVRMIDRRGVLRGLLTGTAVAAAAPVLTGGPAATIAAGTLGAPAGAGSPCACAVWGAAASSSAAAVALAACADARRPARPRMSASFAPLLPADAQVRA